jgi:hypothetical protein
MRAAKRCAPANGASPSGRGYFSVFAAHPITALPLNVPRGTFHPAPQSRRNGACLAPRLMAKQFPVREPLHSAWPAPARPSIHRELFSRNPRKDGRRSHPLAPAPALPALGSETPLSRWVGQELAATDASHRPRTRSRPWLRSRRGTSTRAHAWLALPTSRPPRFNSAYEPRRASITSRAGPAS